MLNEGYRARELARPVTPCSFESPTGFIPAAGFLRTAFHDVAPHNSAAGTGGLDASINFELTGDGGRANAGPFANNTLTFLSSYYSNKASMSDLLALATYTAVRGCGGPAIPIKTGRKDAEEAGALGVPAPTDSQQTLKDSFARMGFDTQDMIKLVACGHTLGGVHQNQFPQVGVNGSTPSNVQNFDTTEAKFDSRVAKEFVSNTTQNPLVNGNPNATSDKLVFTADGGNTIKQLADEQTFQQECKVMLQKMIDVVPSGVSLTEAIEVYDVKPGSLSLALSGNSSLVFSGEVRVRTTNGDVGSVELVYKTRNGQQGSNKITTTAVGTATGHDDSFTFYSFSANLDLSTSISSFDVIVDGETYDNNGESFPVQDNLFVQLPDCTLSATTPGRRFVNIVAAVRGSADSVSMTSTTHQARDVPKPLLASDTTTLTKASSVGEYSLYEGTFEISEDQLMTTTFDLSATVDGDSIEDKFHRVAGFGGDAASGDDDGDNNDAYPTGSDNYTPSRPCGEFEACEALPWANNMRGPRRDAFAPPTSSSAAV